MTDLKGNRLFQDPIVTSETYEFSTSEQSFYELLSQFIEGPAPAVVHAERRPGDVDRHFADTTKAQRLLGFAPTTSIEAGLARTVEWFRAQGIAQSTHADEAGAPNW